VKEARTSYVVERRLEGAALLRCTLHTGRTHQIRLHMAHIGHPLLGDARYGGPTSYAGRELPGHLLHAAALELRHPITGEPLELRSPLPELFAAVIRDT
jgi:23S rRNA pseudouridine1911/1915/1917 synthase